MIPSTPSPSYPDVTLDNVRAAIHQLYTSSSSATTSSSSSSSSPSQTQAQGYLTHVQKSPQAWEIAFSLLSTTDLGQSNNGSNSNRLNEQFFGALILQQKIAREWNTIPEEQIHPLRQQLIELLCRYATSISNATVVVTKLCLSLTSYALHAAPNYWPNFVQDFTSTIRSAQTNLASTHEQRIGLELVLLEFLTLLPEEIGRAELIATRRVQLNTELSKSIQFVLELLESALQTPEQGGPVELSILKKFKSKALQCLQSWIVYGVPLQSLGPIIALTLNLLPNDTTFEASCEVLTELLTQPTAASYEETLCTNLLALITSNPWVISHFQEALTDGIDEEFLKPFVRLIMTLGETFPNYFVKHLSGSNDTISKYLEMVLAITGLEGAFVGDEEISDVTLEFWNLLVETISTAPYLSIANHSNASEGDLVTDPLTGKPIVLNTGSGGMDSKIVGAKSVNVTAQAEDARKLEEAELILDRAKMIYVQVVKVICRKMEFPDDSEWQTYNNDMRERFRSYRRNCSDTLLSIYYFLGVSSLEYLVSIVLDEIQKLKSIGGFSGNNDMNSPRWQRLEAHLYAIKGVSEGLPNTESQYLHLLFHPDTIGPLLHVSETANRSSTKPIGRILYTLCLLIGALSEWFKTFPKKEYLNVALQVLVKCLESPELCPAAAVGLKELCDVCRKELKESVGWLVGLYGQVEGKIKPSEKAKVVEAIAEVLETLSKEDLMEPLVAILGDIVGKLRTSLNDNSVDIATKRQVVMTQLQYLGVFIRGLVPKDETDETSPTDNVIDLTSADDVSSNMLSPNGLDPQTGGPMSANSQRSFMLNIDQHRAISEALVSVTNDVLVTFGRDWDVVESVCSFLNSCLRTDLPFLYLQLPFLCNTILLGGLREFGHACFIQTMSVFFGMVLVGYQDSNTSGGFIEHKVLPGPVGLEVVAQIPALVDGVFKGVTEIVGGTILNEKGVEEHPDLMYAYFEMLNTLLRQKPAVLADLPPTHLQLIFGSLLLYGLRADERLSLRSVLAFFVEFICHNHERSSLFGLVQNVLNQLGLEIVKEIIIGIATRHPRTMTPLLSEALFRLITRYPTLMRGWMVTLFSQEGFPSQLLTQQDKDGLVKAAMMTRQLRKFKEIMKEFASKCRGLQNTAI